MTHTSKGFDTEVNLLAGSAHTYCVFMMESWVDIVKNSLHLSGVIQPGFYFYLYT